MKTAYGLEDANPYSRASLLRRAFELRHNDERPALKEKPPKFCCDCGAPVWPLKGTHVLTCKRGHHQPNLWL